MASKPKPPDPKDKPPGPIPPGALVITDDGSVARLLPEYGEGLGGIEREGAAIINEATFPIEAIRERCRRAGYDVSSAHAA